MDRTVVASIDGIRLFAVAELADAIDATGDAAAVVLIDAATEPDIERALASCDAHGAIGIVVSEPSGAADRFVGDPRIAGWLTAPIDPTALVGTVGIARANRSLHRRVAAQAAESEQLLAIGLSLSGEKDMKRLQELIVQSARELTNADSGSLFLVEDDGQAPELRFVIAQTGGKTSHFAGSTLPLTSGSICGHVALTGETLRIEDAHQIDPAAPYRFNADFDRANGYRTKSVLCVPLRNHRGAIVGVVQLINRKPRFDLALQSPEHTASVVLPFDDRDQRVLLSLASQAGIALDNETLLDSVEELFEKFVHASVKAIEVRDRATLGHSERVARLTVAQAEAVNAAGSGVFADMHFDEPALREMRYASLLHDFGKVTVPEHIISKAKKLPDGKIDEIRLRFLIAIEQSGDDESIKAELLALLKAVERANEPHVTERGLLLDAANYTGRTYGDIEQRRPLLSPSEYEYLTIPRGSLTADERATMEAHVTQSYLFLREIPWRRTPWKRVPEIAYGHHEHLDGTGYPRGLKAAEIPPQVRMMTIADIFDALTAHDRPYKPSLSIERALEILDLEFARKGKIDSNLLDLFITRRLYDIGAPLR